MKKMLLFAAALLLGLVACTKTDYVTQSSVYSLDYEVKPSDWKSNDNPNYWYVSFPNRYITSEVEKGQGAVVGYVWIVYDVNTKEGAWNLLPYVTPFPYAEVDENGNYVYDKDGNYIIAGYVAESIRMEWEEGKVTFLIQDMDGVLPVALGPDDRFLFRVCVIQ